MARIESYEKQVALATAGIAPQNLARELALFAKAELAKTIADGTGSPRYDRYVNGALGANEFTVVPPGPIIYDFHWWEDIIEYAIDVLRARSPATSGEPARGPFPTKSGSYRDSWFPMLNGVIVTDYAAIPIDATVIITNNQPYARKIEVGHSSFSVSPGVVEDSTMRFRQRFGNLVQAKATMVALPGGYTLKGIFRRGIREQSRSKLRKDTMAGSQMTYPAMTLKMIATSDHL